MAGISKYLLSIYLIPLEPIEGPSNMTMPVTFTSDDVWIRRHGAHTFGILEEYRGGSRLVFTLADTV